MKVGSINNLLSDYPIIYSKRLIIRPYHYCDIDDIYEIFSSKKASKYIKLYHNNKKVTEKYIKDKIKNAHSSNVRDWVLENELNKVIGVIRLRFNLDKKEVEISCVLNENETKKGYAYEGCSNIINYCFNNYDIDSFIAYVNKNNKYPIKLLSKLSFKLENQLLINIYRLKK